MERIRAEVGLNTGQSNRSIPPSTPRETSHAEMALDKQEQGLVELADRINCLRERLGPVLNSPVQSAQGEEKRPRFDAELVEQIAMRGDHIRSLREEVEVIIARLAI